MPDLPLRPSAIEIHDFSYAYPPVLKESPWRWALQDISLQIPAGTFAAIMGASGAGKSTLALALNGIVPQSTGGRVRGTVTVAGFDARRHPVAELARRVAMVFQDPESGFLQLDVEAEVAFGPQNLGLPVDEIGARVHNALERVGLAGFEQRSPFELSGGQKQRVAIAAALAMQPQILVLDEPTTNLDPRGKSEVFAVLDDLRRTAQTTIMMITHEAEAVADFAQQVIVLHAGRLALQDEPGALFARVDALHSLGVAAPQVSQVAAQLNRNHGTALNFSRLKPAVKALAAAFESHTA